MAPNPQPNLPKSMTTPWSSVQAGTGQNTKGSQPAYSGPKGKFQWGHNQYGYINPQGNIGWNAQAGSKKGYIAAAPVNAWAQQSGQLASRVDPYGMQVQPKVGPPPYLDPAYGVQAAQLTANRSMQQRELANQISQMKSSYGTELGQFQTDFDRSMEQLKAGLGSRGISRSGIAGKEVSEGEAGYLRGLESLGQQFGGPAQERIRSTQKLVDTNLRAQLQAEQKLSKERALAENEYRLAQGLEPKTIEGKQKGFFKKGSTWFYRNPAGVEVSVEGSPYQKQIGSYAKMIRVEQKKAAPDAAKIEKWRKAIGNLRKKDS